MAIALTDFVEKFASIFEETDQATITADTKFKELEEWDSMIALSVIAMADDEFDVKIKGDDIRNSTTVEDLYNKIQNN